MKNPTPTVYDPNGPVEEWYDTEPEVEPTPSFEPVEALLDMKQAERFLDSLGALNWRKWPSAPASINVGGRLMYSENDLRWWIEKWRNNFVDPDTMTFERGEVVEPWEFGRDANDRE